MARKALVVIVIVFGLVGGTATSVEAADVGATIVVSSGLDNDERDDELTLREAIMLSEGSLAKSELTLAEAARVIGTPGKKKEDTLNLDVVSIALKKQLPDVTDSGTIIRGVKTSRTDIFGLGIHFGLIVKTDKFSIEKVAFHDFNQDISYEVNVPAGTRASASFKDLGFDKSKGGLIAKAGGRGFLDFELEDSDFTSLDLVGLRVEGSVAAQYDIKHNRLLNLDSKAATQFELGGGAGKITVDYTDNRHSTKNGTGTILDEVAKQELGIDWIARNNYWLGGRTGMEATVQLGGRHDFSNDEFRAHEKAGLNHPGFPGGSIS